MHTEAVHEEDNMQPGERREEETREEMAVGAAGAHRLAVVEVQMCT